MEILAVCPKCTYNLHLPSPEWLGRKAKCPRCTHKFVMEDAKYLKQEVESSPPKDTIASGYFGDYEILEEIGRGGMGVIYKAKSKKLNCVVALKVIIQGKSATEEEVQRFQSEAQAARSLHHEGIVPIYEVGEFRGRHFFSMAYIDGKSLAHIVARGPLIPRDAAQMTNTIANVIAFAHKNGVIHRDLKPANVLLARVDENMLSRHPTAISLHCEGMKPGHFEPKITDFGLAKRLDDGGQMTVAGRVFGSPSYMPPEQASGNWGEVGMLADVYSIGAILYCLLTGKPPFLTSNVVVTLMQVCEASPVPPNLLNPQIDADLNAICLKCLEKSPQNRYGSCRELAEDLSRYLEGVTVMAAQPATNSSLPYGPQFERGLTKARTAWGIQAVRVALIGLVAGAMIAVGVETLWMCLLPGIAAVLYFAGQGIPIRRRRGIPSLAERQVSQIWGLFLFGSTLTIIAGELRGIALLDLLPIIVLEYALVYAFAGLVLAESLYPFSLLCACAALVMAWMPQSSLYLFGSVFLLGIGFALWKHR